MSRTKQSGRKSVSKSAKANGKGGVYRCPGCTRVLSSAAALIAHAVSKGHYAGLKEASKEEQDTMADACKMEDIAEAKDGDADGNGNGNVKDAEKNGGDRGDEDEDDDDDGRDATGITEEQKLLAKKVGEVAVDVADSK